MRRLLAIPVVVFATLVCWLAAAPAALAGGWTVTTLDPLPPIEAGRSAPVTFRVLQHGVHPVDLDRVELTVTGVDGETHHFAARKDGAIGHYVADVTLPAAGTYAWTVRPGGFPLQDLGTVTVAPRRPTSTATVAADDGSDGGITALQYLLPLATAASAALCLVAVRRQRHALPPVAST